MKETPVGKKTPKQEKPRASDDPTTINQSEKQKTKIKRKSE
jgi:hypothetical protein